jgi:hypothetical protein
MALTTMGGRRQALSGFDVHGLLSAYAACFLCSPNAGTRSRALSAVYSQLLGSRLEGE